MSQTILNVEDLRIYHYPRTGVVKAVDGVSFEIREDEVFGLIGESGSGKSTLSAGLLGLVSPPSRIESGRATFLGTDLLTLRPEDLRRMRWEKLAYIPQGAQSALNPVMSIRDHFYDTVADHGAWQSKKVTDERIGDLLARVHLSRDVLRKYPHELSGGMKQRVCIALAMLLRPGLIIADEPTSALDVISQRAVLETLADERAKLQTSMILIGHDMAVQAQVADRLGIMFQGRLVEIASVRDIFHNPMHPYTRRLISSLPSIRKKQDIHALARTGLDEADAFRFGSSGTLVEVKPGHFVAQDN
jgi:ABC-type dipeptide/oligopeptide/nickel transport system ATPase component